MEISKRVNDLIVILDRFAEVLEQENTALRTKEIDQISDLLEDKSTLSRVYESRVMGLAENLKDLANVDSALRERLRTLGFKVSKLMEDNSFLLKIAIETQRRVAEVIRQSVQSNQPGAITYSPSGDVSKRASGQPVSTAPIAVNRSL